MIIELHLLQSFPVSNLNRDDVGQPKTATFGGQLRGRISSQSLKRSARVLFTDRGLQAGETGVRTKRLVSSATRVLVDNGRDEAEAVAVAQAGLRALGFGIDDKKQLTQYLLFVGNSAAERSPPTASETGTDSPPTPPPEPRPPRRTPPPSRASGSRRKSPPRRNPTSKPSPRRPGSSTHAG